MNDEIRELKQKIEKLEHELYLYKHDQLTGLLMRRDFDEKFDKMFFDGSKKFYLTMIDANGLHNINREKGYTAGDEYVRSIVHKLENCSDNVVYRIGGDEFAILSYEKIICPDSNQYSYGLVSSEGCETIKEMIDKADIMLINKKNEFYRKTENERRRHG